MSFLTGRGARRPRGYRDLQGLNRDAVSNDPPNLERPRRERRPVERFGPTAALSQLSASQSSQSQASRSLSVPRGRRRSRHSESEDFQPRAASVKQVPTPLELDIRLGVMQQVFAAWTGALDVVLLDRVLTKLINASASCMDNVPALPGVDLLTQLCDAIVPTTFATLLPVQQQYVKLLCSAVYPVWLKHQPAAERPRITRIRDQFRVQLLGGESAMERALVACEPYTLGVLRNCVHCPALLWPHERGNPTPCCGSGRYVLQAKDVPHIPAALKGIYSDPVFVKHARRINHLLSFTAMGTSPSRSQQGRGFYSLPFPSVVRMEGKSYHLMVPNDVHGPCHFYVISDPSATSDPRLTAANIPTVHRGQVAAFVDMLRRWFLQHHPAACALKMMADVR